jgi:hypothetical protein
MSNSNTAAPQTSNGSVSGSGQNAAAAPTIVYAEPPAAFASGLPAWSIEPPEVVVRRKARI